MATIIGWIATNWMPVCVALLTVDTVLIPIFPNATILQRLADFLKGVGAKPPTV